MSPTLEACMRSWPWDPWLLATCFASAAIYFRGWWHLARRARRRWSAWRLAAFVGGVLAVFLALGSPIEPFAALHYRLPVLNSAPTRPRPVARYPLPYSYCRPFSAGVMRG